ncbi:MAG: terminase small subunit [Deltaproteobacteria bacterium]|nr:terminase small subunit [Deltaproteobacteria bacterium]
MPKTLKPTVRQRRFVKAIMEGCSQTDAAIRAGYKPSNATDTASKLIRTNETVRAMLLSEFEKAGITDRLVAEKMREGLDAMTPPRKEGGSRYEDFFVRKQYLDIYFRLIGAYAPEKVEMTEKKIVINITPEFVKGLMDAKAIDETEARVIEAEVLESEPLGKGA